MAFVPVGQLYAQTAPAAPAAARQIGSVQAIDGSTLTLGTDTGQQVTVSVSPSARILQLAPGSTDLKTAQAAALTDVAVGDRILVTGAAGDAPGSFNASRLILMKSSDIAQRREADQADWQKRGTGGIVTAVDASTGALTISSGARKLQVATSAATKYRRYADGSVRFEDAKPGTLSQIQTGDQIRLRGARSEDGSSIQAEEIVSGSFRNLSGTLLSVDASAGTVTLKDLATKKNVTVQVTANSAVHKLPVQAATAFAARAKGEPAAAGAGQHAAPAGAPAASPGAQGGEGQGAGRASGDLSQMIARLPAESLSSLHVGDAVMIVAEQSSSSNSYTAITLLSGVEPILAAAPNGSNMTLSPWSVGGGAPEGGGA